MNNKVKFLRGTSDEYAVAEKDSDTIYFTTDDGKLYIGNKEISASTGGGSYTLPIATTEILGGVMPDGTTITVDSNGVISSAGGLTVDTLLDITISTSENSPANGSIITLDGNIFDYKFIYSVPVYNEKVTVFTYAGTNGISFFNTSILARAGYADKSFQLSSVSNEVSVDCISPTQIKIGYWGTPKGVISRVIILGIK